MRSTEDGLKNDQRNSSLQSDAAVPGEDGISVEVIETAAGAASVAVLKRMEASK